MALFFLLMTTSIEYKVKFIPNSNRFTNPFFSQKCSLFKEYFFSQNLYYRLKSQFFYDTVLKQKMSALLSDSS